MVVVRRRGENPSRVRVDAHGVGGLCTLCLINRTGGPKLDAVEDKKGGDSNSSRRGYYTTTRSDFLIGTKQSKYSEWR